MEDTNKDTVTSFRCNTEILWSFEKKETRQGDMGSMF